MIRSHKDIKKGYAATYPFGARRRDVFSIISPSNKIVMARYTRTSTRTVRVRVRTSRGVRTVPVKLTTRTVTVTR